MQGGGLCRGGESRDSGIGGIGEKREASIPCWQLAAGAGMPCTHGESSRIAQPFTLGSNRLCSRPPRSASSILACSLSFEDSLAMRPCHWPPKGHGHTHPVPGPVPSGASPFPVVSELGLVVYRMQASGYLCSSSVALGRSPKLPSLASVSASVTCRE